MSALAQASVPDHHAVCAAHPEQTAVGTCARCGRFTCGACRNDDAVCTACVELELSAMPALRPRAAKAVWLLRANVAVESLGMVTSFGLLASPESEPLLLGSGLVGILLFFTYVATVVFYLRWLHLAVRTVKTRGQDVGVTPGWAVGWWFIPFANLVKPYHTVRALVAASGGEPAVARARVGLWWAAWIIGNVLSNIETRLNLSDIDGAQSGGTFVGVFSSLFGVLGAWLCIGVIRRVGEGLQR